jgi:hypothetical protein
VVDYAIAHPPYNIVKVLNLTAVMQSMGTRKPEKIMTTYFSENSK